ncbi:apolipoprotein N-acyltransferase [Candidatus Pelagibacter sp.]|nr:apolipoprotein N-acyltransferase [Candidatus Pelagibacter sp.]
MINLINIKKYYYLLPFILGGITSISLPPYNLFFLNFLTFPFLLFILIESQNIKKSNWLSFCIGWFFGIGYFLSNIYWIVYSLTFEDIFKPIIPFALIIIPTFLGLFYGLVTFTVSKFKPKKNISTILIFALIFSIIEFFRGFLFGGFPWNLVVYSWSGYINSIQILSLIGTYSFNLISITLFVLPIFFVFKKNIRSNLFLFLFLTIILVSNNFYGLWKIKKDNFLFNRFESFSLKIISPKISIDRFFQNDNQEIIIDELIELSKPDFSKRTIFIFPEGALAGISLDDLRNFKEKFSNNFSSEHRIIIGINTEYKIDGFLKTYNSMVILDNKLNLLSEYNKNKLVPFGEFLPFENLIRKFGFKKVTKGYNSFSSGKIRKLQSIDNINFNFIPLICYEIIYSGGVSSTLDNTNFIINISEDGWFGNSIGPHQHFSHSIFRSIEEGKNIFRSSNNGISAYIDSNGLVIHRLESTQRGVIEVTNYKNLEKTTFSKFGNKIFFYFILFYIILIFFINKRERE